MKMSNKRTMNSRLILSMKIVVMLLIIWALVHHAQLRLGLFYTIFGSPLTIFMVISLCYAMVLVSTFRWYRLNEAQGIPLSLSQTVIPAYLGIAFNTVLPGSVGGDFVRLHYILKKFPQQKSRAILSIFVDRMSGFLGIFIIIGCSAPYYLSIFNENSKMHYFLLGCIFIFVVVVFSARSKLRLMYLLNRQFKNELLQKKLISILDAIRCYKNAKWILLESIFLSMATQVLLVIVIALISKSMGLPTLSLLDYLMALVIAQVANILPLTPGGLGVGEVAFANIILLLNPGVSAAYATTFFALRLFSAIAYLPGVLLGIFGYHLLHED